MSDVTSHPLANQADTSLCEVYDHEAAFLLVKTVLQKNCNLHI